MRRISGSTVDVDEFGTGKDGYTSGDPQSGVPPTELSADCLDAIQEERAVCGSFVPYSDFPFFLTLHSGHTRHGHSAMLVLGNCREWPEKNK